MLQYLKERLVGAAVLVILAVVFIPVLLTGSIDSTSITETNIPERPTEKFNSRLLPLTDSLKPITEAEDNSAMRSQISDNHQEKNAAEAIANESGKNAPEISKTNNETPIVARKSTQEKVIKDKQAGLTAWVVQLGSFSGKANADKLNLDLRESGFPAFVESLTKKGRTSYRVRVGPEILRADADALLKKIKTKMKLEGIVLNYL